MNRQTFVREYPHLFLLDQADPVGLVRYLATRGLLSRGETLLDLSKAGDGNMNCTLCATTTRRRLIVKQARPWVEKYDHIPAPWDRSLVEAAFYRAVERCPGFSGQMPRLIDADAAGRGPRRMLPGGRRYPRARRLLSWQLAAHGRWKSGCLGLRSSR